MSTRDTRTRSGTAVVTEAAAQAALRRTTTRDLSPEEERVLRMRLGASPSPPAPLERTLTADEELEIEVRAAEIETFLRWKAHVAARAPAAARPRLEPARARTKEKILRALRRK
jgi:hypothetical protein